MTSFIDTHCHLDMLKMDVEEALQKANDADVHQLITIATDEPSIQFVQKTVLNSTQIYGSVGVHPHEAKTYSHEIENLIREATSIKNIIAIGETGLDYHYMHSDKDIQQEVFRQQLQLAEQLRMPIVLHTREAQDDTLAILKENPVTKKGVAHSFTSGLAMAKILLEMDWYIGINGIATFRNAEDVREVARFVPLDRLLLETDAPFLSPIPFRGKPNDSSKIPVIAKFIANERQISLETLASQTNQNAQQLFQFN